MNCAMRRALSRTANIKCSWRKNARPTPVLAGWNPTSRATTPSWFAARAITSILLRSALISLTHRPNRQFSTPRRSCSRSNLSRKWALPRGTRRLTFTTCSTAAARSGASISTYTHANMVPVLDGIEGKQMPEAALVCNFPMPSGDDPGLMEFADVQTFFHEFGHLMHFILGGHQQWAGISGITMEADFAEAPSEMLENWMLNANVLGAFARDYRTRQPIPADLVARMDRALAFGRGLDVAQQTRYTAISYDIYSTAPDQVNLDQVTESTMKQFTPFTELPGTHMWASFGHLAGYSSAYYTYMWDLVIAQDFYAQFNQSNPMLGDVPAKYRKTVLEPGGSVSANDLVKNFLGRPQNTKAFQVWMSAEFAESGSSGSSSGASDKLVSPTMRRRSDHANA